MRITLSEFLHAFYIHPFDNEQSQRLIDKLLRNVDDPSAKEKIQKYMDEGFIRKEGMCSRILLRDCMTLS